MSKIPPHSFFKPETEYAHTLANPNKIFPSNVKVSAKEAVKCKLIRKLKGPGFILSKLQARTIIHKLGAETGDVEPNRLFIHRDDLNHYSESLLEYKKKNNLPYQEKRFSQD